jgi:glutamine amidotransferase PdxT
MALSFHPELSSDLRLHKEFLRLVRGKKEKTAA